MMVAVDTKPVGLIAVSDTIRENAAAAVGELHQMGLVIQASWRERSSRARGTGPNLISAMGTWSAGAQLPGVVSAIGKAIKRPRGLKTYPVKTEAGKVLVEI